MTELSDLEQDDLQQAIRENSSRLLQLVQCRLSPQLNRRFDAEDVLQEALLNAAKRWPQYVAEPRVSVYVWLRGIVMDRMIDLVRFHTAEMRNVNRERMAETFDDRSSMDFANHWFAHFSTPSQSLMAREKEEAVKASLERLSERHRNLLMMRFFEKLSIREVADVLSISISNAKVTQFRALRAFNEHLIALSRSKIQERR